MLPFKTKIFNRTLSIVKESGISSKDGNSEARGIVSIQTGVIREIEVSASRDFDETGKVALRS